MLVFKKFYSTNQYSFLDNLRVESDVVIIHPDSKITYPVSRYELRFMIWTLTPSNAVIRASSKSSLKELFYELTKMIHK